MTRKRALSSALILTLLLALLPTLIAPRALPVAHAAGVPIFASEFKHSV